jgi:hypothetical protein
MEPTSHTRDGTIKRLQTRKRQKEGKIKTRKKSVGGRFPGHSSINQRATETVVSLME